MVEIPLGLKGNVAKGDVAGKLMDGECPQSKGRHLCRIRRVCLKVL